MQCQMVRHISSDTKNSRKKQSLFLHVSWNRDQSLASCCLSSERLLSCLLVKAQRPSSLAVPAAGEPGLWTSQGDAEVKLRMGESGLAAETPLTVNQMFTLAVERYGDYKALSWKEGEQQKSLTYREYYQSCRTAAKSFMKVDFYLLSNHDYKEQLNKKGSKHRLYCWIIILCFSLFFLSS